MGDLIHRFLWCDDAKQNGKALYYDNSYMKYYTIHCMSLLSWNSDVANYTALSIEFIHEDNEYKDTLHMHQNKQHSHSPHCNCKSCFNNFFCVRYILTATPILRVRAFAALAIGFGQHALWTVKVTISIIKLPRPWESVHQPFCCTIPLRYPIMPGRVKWCRSQCFCNISPKGTYSCLAWFNPVISLHFHAAALLVRDSELWPIVQIRTWKAWHHWVSSSCKPSQQKRLCSCSWSWATHP